MQQGRRLLVEQALAVILGRKAFGEPFRQTGRRSTMQMQHGLLQHATGSRHAGNELCIRVTEATSRRFFGDGKTPYHPPKEAPKF